ncbi:unnamed protein product [Arabidopsis arenosa]|uniref:Uncharacterized protein n=1 Tax=Arabidopsis arenosa TaxID=38785 RepID=A0A8S1ZNQ3_ARAAE|nr:unnamed protein product [Arabidopsis arenosa]
MVVPDFVVAREAKRSCCVAVGVALVRLLEDGADLVVISGGSRLAPFRVLVTFRWLVGFEEFGAWAILRFSFCGRIRWFGCWIFHLSPSAVTVASPVCKFWFRLAGVAWDCSYFRSWICFGRSGELAPPPTVEMDLPLP